MSKNIGYKGFDKLLKCRGFQYEVGETYAIDGSPKMCNTGFHFCEQLAAVNGYYPFDTSRICIIEHSGTTITSGDKSCTNTITIVRELPLSEIYELLLLDKLRVTRRMPDNVIIGGSIALMMRKVIPYRQAKDLDIVQPYFIPIDGAEYSYTTSFSTDNEATKVTFEGNNIDLFLDAKATYSIIKFHGLDYKVQTPEKIIEAKMRYFMQGNVKHIDDISHYMAFKKNEFANNGNVPLPF